MTFGVTITLFTLSGCSGNSNQQNTPATEEQSAAANGFTPDAVDNAHHNVDTVVIKAMVFTPANVTIAKGDTVYWINNDVVAHDVSQFPNRTWKSALLQPGEHFTQAFDDSSSYYCSIHPNMHGIILIK